ncbi:MAG: acyl carrier protein [Archangiaceae bacterium]|nr:acyl carrier protein [Archangiaceae bacterium]
MAESLEDAVLAEIRRIFATELEREEPVEPAHELLAQLHVDSLAAIVIAVGLENRFRVKLSEEDTVGVVTVADLVERVAARVKASA